MVRNNWMKVSRKVSQMKSILVCELELLKKLNGKVDNLKQPDFFSDTDDVRSSKKGPIMS